VDLNEVRQIFNDVVKDGNRAGEVIDRVRDLIKKAPPQRDRLEINGAIRGEAMKNGVSVRTELTEGLPLIEGDRVQLQQVMLNLIINAIQAMSGHAEASANYISAPTTPSWKVCGSPCETPVRG
jgi:C4-dicarboxylate-specific signal transduction histidine kinase